MSILNSYLVTSQLLRPFDPRDDDDPNCSKIGHHRVQKGEVFDLSFFCTFLLCVTHPLNPPPVRGTYILWLSGMVCRNAKFFSKPQKWSLLVTTLKKGGRTFLSI